MFLSRDTASRVQIPSYGLKGSKISITFKYNCIYKINQNLVDILKIKNVVFENSQKILLIFKFIVFNFENFALNIYFCNRLQLQFIDNCNSNDFGKFHAISIIDYKEIPHTQYQNSEIKTLKLLKQTKTYRNVFIF